MASLGFSDPRISNPVLRSLMIKSTDQIVLVRENPLADSNFIITHLLKQLLFDKNKVVFLTLHNTFDHYQNVGKKLGYDLEQAVDKGNVKIIDPLQQVLEDFGIDDVDNPITKIPQKVFQLIDEQIQEFQSIDEQPVHLVIDDLSHLLDLNIELSSVVHFSNLCMNLTNDKNVSLIVNTHVSNSQSDLILSNNVQYCCDVVINVSALKTGRSTDVTGIMSVQRGGNTTTYHYKALDRGVKTFLPGESIHRLYK